MKFVMAFAGWPSQNLFFAKNTAEFLFCLNLLVRWMCDIKVKDRVPNKELRETRNR